MFFSAGIAIYLRLFTYPNYINTLITTANIEKILKQKLFKVYF